MSRYSRHIILSDIGQSGQDKISQAKVLVIGAGGLGCPILQYLAAAGVGTLGIIDFDVVMESNLQRQILFGTSSLGMNKAQAAKQRLEDLNPLINIVTYPEKLTSENAIALFKDFDIIVDGTDNFSTRYLVNDAAIITGKPVVFGAIYKFEGQISVFNYNDGPSYRCLFPKQPKAGSVANCSDVGVLGVLPGIIGTMQANEVLKIILGFKNVLSGKLLCYNAKTAQTTTLKIKKSEAEIDKVLSKKDNLIEGHTESSCSAEIKNISVAEAILKEHVQFIDVRESHEQPQIDLSNCIQIPLTTLASRINELDNTKTNIIFCQSGKRSKIAVQLLQKHKIDNCYNLKEGVLALINELKVKV